MNSLTENVLSSMDIIFDHKVAGLKFDATIEGIITDVSGAGNSLSYMINYNNKEFLAYSSNIELKYEIGDKVYVKIPNNDWTSRKIITGIIADQYENKEINYSKINWFFASPNLILRKNIYELKQTENNIPAFSSGNFRPLENYRKGKNLLRLSAEFRTNFRSPHTKGNYGVQIILLKTDKNGKEYKDEILTLDLTNFNGNPYAFSSWVEQSAVFTLDPHCSYSIKDIQFFLIGFEGDNEDKIYTEEQGNKNLVWATNPDTLVYINNLNLSFVDNNVVESGGYHIEFSTPYGLVFNPSPSFDNLNKEEFVDTITITPTLYFGYTEIESSKVNNWRWFIEDSSSITSEIGTGWSELKENDKNFNIESMSKNNGFLKLGYPVSLSGEDKNINWENINLKLAASYTNNGETIEIISNPITVSKDDVLEYTTFYNWGSHDFTIIITGKNKTSIKGEQYKSILRMNNFTIQENEMNSSELDQFEIKLSRANYYFSTYSNERMYLDIYSMNNGLLIATFEMPQPEKPEQENGNEKAYIAGEDIFKYEANGKLHSSYINSVYDLQLVPIGEQKIDNIEWYIQSDKEWIRLEESTEETEFKREKYSLMKNLYIKKGVLYFSLQEMYDLNLLENNFLIKFTSEGLPYSLNKKVTYLKDGDNGTNGSGYYCTLTFEEEIKADGDENSKILYYYSSTEEGQGNQINSNAFKYKVKCFLNGESVNIEEITVNNKNSLEYSNVYNVSIKEENIIEVSLNSRFFENESNYLESYGDSVLYIKLSITPEGQNFSIPYYLAPPYCVQEIEAQDIKSLNNKFISTIPTTIMYDTNGYSPNWSGSSNSYVDLKPYKRGTLIGKYGNNNLLVLENSTLKPTYYFTGKDYTIFEIYQTISIRRNNGNKISYQILYPIIFYINTYGNEQINGWDGQKLSIDDKTNKYILAPTLGAGKKNSDNKFTGVVMGIDAQQDKTGLYGYKDGKKTFSFDEDGNGFLAGTIEASSGNIGGWDINNHKYESNNYTELEYTIENFYNNEKSARIFLRPATAKAGEDYNAIFAGTVQGLVDGSRPAYEGKIFAIRNNGMAEFRGIDIFGGPPDEDGNKDYSDNKTYGQIKITKKTDSRGNKLAIFSMGYNDDCYIGFSTNSTNGNENENYIELNAGGSLVILDGKTLADLNKLLSSADLLLKLLQQQQ